MNAAHRLADSVRSLVSYWTPAPTVSNFVAKGTLTPSEFVDAGDQIAFKFPTWKWQTSDARHRVSWLPPDKQYLLTRNVPCRLRISDLESALKLRSGDDIDGDWVLPGDDVDPERNITEVEISSDAAQSYSQHRLCSGSQNNTARSVQNRQKFEASKLTIASDDATPANVDIISASPYSASCRMVPRNSTEESRTTTGVTTDSDSLLDVAQQQQLSRQESTKVAPEGDNNINNTTTRDVVVGGGGDQDHHQLSQVGSSSGTIPLAAAVTTTKPTTRLNEKPSHDEILDISSFQAIDDLLEEYDPTACGGTADGVLRTSTDTEILKVRSYDLSITYDKYYQTPRIWLFGYDENGIPLTPDLIVEDIMADYVSKTITIDPHPCTGIPTVSIHPCKHAEVMQKVVASWVSANIEPRHDLALFVLLKFIASVVPTIEYDFTMDVDMFTLPH